MSDARSSSDSHGLRQKLSSLSKGDLIEELIGALMKVTELSARPGGVAQAAPEPLDYGDELLRWSNIEVALRKKFPTLNATGIEIDNWPALIDALAMSSTDRRAERCAECTCANGGSDCTWLASPASSTLPRGEA